jgi:metallo-beta-lactamase class B
MSVLKTLTVCLIVLAATAGFGAAAAPLPPLDKAAQAMNRPIAPFCIANEICYVGTEDLGIYLIKMRAGDILIDGGYEQTVPQILANLKTLGIDPKNIRILLNSHTHRDHAGGLAALKTITGAKLIAGRVAAAELARGGRNDPNFANTSIFPPVKADSIVEDGGTVALGNVVLTAHLTPGHTKGCTTWTMPAHIAGKTYTALFLCSVSAPGYKLIGNAAYPDIVADYRHSFAVLKTLPCELFLGAHASFYDMLHKRAEMEKTGSPLAFVDPAGCRRYLDKAETAFDKAVAEQSH